MGGYGGALSDAFFYDIQIKAYMDSYDGLN